MIGQHYLDDSLRQLEKLKAQADRAMAQLDDGQLFTALDAESNSIATIMKHMAGNMRSRWTDFLTSDGEKPDRNRDTEFELTPADTAAQVRSAWENGWTLLLAAVAALTPADLEKTIYIRGEAHTVVEAINRQAMHYAAHVGQIVMLAKHLAGPRWQTLSIPKRKSTAAGAAGA
jgi:enamine deaminase RidA (YjgF/YER057c/UK114 family)